MNEGSTATMQDEFVVTESAAPQRRPFPVFIDEMLEGYKVVESISTHPTFIVFGNGRIVNLQAEPVQVSSSTGYREGRRITFTYRLPEDRQLIIEHLIPLSRQYFGGTHG